MFYMKCTCRNCGFSHEGESARVSDLISSVRDAHDRENPSCKNFRGHVQIESSGYEHVVEIEEYNGTP